MKKRLLTLLFAAVICSMTVFTAAAAQTDEILSPFDTVTVAEGIMAAARIYEAENGVKISGGDGDNWYDKYVDYALANNIISKSSFDSYERELKRYEAAELFAGASSELDGINTVNEIPDVPDGISFYPEVLELYEAGVLVGNDNYGTFKPQGKLLRNELASMTARIADPEKRITKTFEEEPARVLGDAAYIMDTDSRHAGRKSLANGWRYDNRFDLTNLTGETSYYLSNLVDTSNTKFYRFLRDIKPQSSGTLESEMIIGAYSAEDETVYIGYFDSDGELVFELTPIGGVWVARGETVYNTGVSVSKTSLNYFPSNIKFDLDKKYAEVSISNGETGYVAIDCKDISRIVLGTKKQGTGGIALLWGQMWKNYVLNEHFMYYSGTDKKLPSEWNVTGSFVAKNISAVPTDHDFKSVRAYDDAGEVSTASKKFEKISGKFAFETMILLPEKTNGASVALMNDGSEILKIETKNGGKFYIGNTLLHDYIANVWQELRIEADTETGKAEIFINGKPRATVDFKSSAFDEVAIKFAPDTDNSIMWFDDVMLHNIIEHEDYPSYPDVAQSDGYNIGINFCSLWRDSLSWEGWDATSAFPELDTYLGFYDEGLKETSDWELKWMAEHGIDFIHTCWYAPRDNITVPFKQTRGAAHAALHDGYMLAEYSNLVDFCIIWENAISGCSSLDQFKKYIWPYWVEYYFTDERYVRLDNKAVLSVYSVDNFTSTFGGTTEGALEAIEFMDTELKTLGYDGLILLMSINNQRNLSQYQSYAELGYDATFAYSWASEGQSADYQINCNRNNTANAKEAGMHHIPTVSVGYNEVARNERRYPIISADGFYEVCEDSKMLLSENTTGTWKDNTIFLSTWNEFSEGTYICPTESTGFGYLEAVRESFANTDKWNGTIDALRIDPYNANATFYVDYIRIEGKDDTVEDIVFNFNSFMNNEGWKINSGTCTAISGSLYCNTNYEDPYIYNENLNIRATDYNKVVVGIKYNNNISNAVPDLFYRTSTDSSFSIERRIAGSYNIPQGVTSGTVVEATFIIETEYDVEHEEVDVKLTDAQLDRISNMYPPNNSLIRWLRKEPADYASLCTSVRKYDMSSDGADGWGHYFGLDKYNEGSTSISGTSSADDFALITTNFVPLDTQSAHILHIRMKSSVESSMYIFLETDVTPSFGSNQIVVPVTNPGSFVDYYIDLTEFECWKDTVTKIRLDPMATPGSFEIEMIDFLAYSEALVKLYVNGNKMDFVFPSAKTSDGDYEVVGRAQNDGFYSTLCLYYEYDRFTDDGVLKLYTRDEKELVFKVGSNKVYVNGVEQNLGYTFKLKDGLPVFRIKKLLDLIGYDYTQSGEKIEVTIQDV